MIPRTKINPKAIPNFVRCDDHCLSFPNKVFSESLCSHVFEHRGVNPAKVVREMIRVSEDAINVTDPHGIFGREKWIMRIRFSWRSEPNVRIRSFGSHYLPNGLGNKSGKRVNNVQ